VATFEEPQSKTLAEPPKDTATAHADTATEVPQHLLLREHVAPTNSPAHILKAVISALERLPSNEENPVPDEATEVPSGGSEELVTTDRTDAPRSQLDDRGHPAANEEPFEDDRQGIRATHPIPVAQTHGLSHPLQAEPDEVRRPIATPAPSADRRLPIPHLINYTAEIDWNPPEAQRDFSLNEPSTKHETLEPASPRPSADRTLPDSPPVASMARAVPAVARPRIESRTNDVSESAKIPTGNIPDDAKAVAPDRPKTAPESPKPAEPLGAPPVLARAPEALPQIASNAPANPATLPPLTPDSIAVPPPPTNVAVATDARAEIPVRLSLATRDGQQTAELQTLALHIAARSARGDSRFTIRLDPPELGRIDVNLNVTSHGHAQAVLAVEKPQTLDLLLRDAPTLERALKDAGLELGSNLSFSLKEEGRSPFARDDYYSPPTRTLELVGSEETDGHATLNMSLAEHLYGLRAARLDITV
jgi:hypothetical protein